MYPSPISRNTHSYVHKQLVWGVLVEFCGICMSVCVFVGRIWAVGGSLTLTRTFSSINVPICLTCLPPLPLRRAKPSPAHPHPSSENGFFGRSLMLMSRPGLSLAAVNRELTRLVVCLYTVVTHLKDGLCPKQVGSFQASS